MEKEDKNQAEEKGEKIKLLHRKMINADRMHKEFSHEYALDLLKKYRRIHRTIEFNDIIRELPEYIGNKELEVWYYLIRRTINGQKWPKEFWRKTDLFNFLRKQEKNYEDSTYNHPSLRDRTQIMGYDGYLDKLFKAGLMTYGNRIKTFNQPTRKYAKIIVPHFWKMQYPKRRIKWDGLNQIWVDLNHQWTEEETLIALEWYLFPRRNETTLQGLIPLNELQNDKNKDMNTIKDELSNLFAMLYLPEPDLMIHAFSNVSGTAVLRDDLRKAGYDENLINKLELEEREHETKGSSKKQRASR